MELKVNAVAIPEAITFNYEELKTELLQKVSVYETMVYGEDQIKEAKADRANLNRLKKALNDERIRREKEYMQPFNQFKAQISEIISIIDKPVAVIDKQVKEYEEHQKSEKMERIDAAFCEEWNSRNLPAAIDIDSIMDHRWLNSSVSMKSIQEAIIAKLDQIEKDLAVVRSLPSYAWEAEQAYLSSLDLAKAVSEAHRLQEQAERKAAYEAERAKLMEPPDFSKLKPGDRVCFAGASETADDIPCTPYGAEGKDSAIYRQWIGFQAFLSVDEAKALGQFMKDNGIKYKKI